MLGMPQPRAKTFTCDNAVDGFSLMMPATGGNTSGTSFKMMMSSAPTS